MTRLRIAACVGFLALAASTAAEAEEPVLRRVALSTAGLGLLELEGRAGPGGVLGLEVPLEQVDDVLKSFVVGAGSNVAVRAVTLPGATPRADLFRGAPVGEAALASLPELLAALRGAEIEVAGAEGARGRIVAVTAEPELRGGEAAVTRHRVAVLEPGGLSSFMLEGAGHLRLVDPALQRRLDDLLGALNGLRQEATRRLEVATTAAEGTPLTLSFLAEAPVWKTSYRLRLAPGRAAMQGWAVLENQSGRDWRQVEVTLVAGGPEALRQALYRSYFKPRREVPVVEDEPPAPATASMAGPKTAARAAPFAAEALADSDDPVPPAALATGAAAEGPAQTAFRLAAPVDVPAGQTVMAPVIDRPIEAVPVTLVDLEAPMPAARVAVRLRNDLATSLPRGLVTVTQDTELGPTFAGDVVLEPLAPGATRLLAFAADPKVELARREDRSSPIRRAAAVDGVIEVVQADRRVIEVEAKAATGMPRALVATAQLPAGWRITAPTEAVITGARVEVERQLVPGAAVAVRLEMEREVARRIELGDRAVEELVAVLGAGPLPEPLARAVRRLRELEAALGDRRLEAERLAEQRVLLVTDQERLRANLDVVPSEGDLGRRYLDALRRSEDAIAAVDAAVAAADARFAAAKAERTQFLRELRL